MRPCTWEFLAAEAATLPGRIGITFVPGKRDNRWSRDLELHVMRLRREYAAPVLVSLIEDHDLDLLGSATRGTCHPTRPRGHPISDPGRLVPASMEGLIGLVATVLGRAQSDRTVVAHCRGGLGRTGLVAARCLAGLGAAPNRAIAEVRRVRPGAVETREQESYVSRFVRVWSIRRAYS